MGRGGVNADSNMWGRVTKQAWCHPRGLQIREIPIGLGPSSQLGFLVWEQEEGIILNLYIKVETLIRKKKKKKIPSGAFYPKNFILRGLQPPSFPRELSFEGKYRRRGNILSWVNQRLREKILLISHQARKLSEEDRPHRKGFVWER